MPLSPRQIAHREYLKSATWKDLRQQVLDRDRSICRKCGNPGYDAHHLTYKNWGNENLEDLITVCRPCHDSIHEAQKGTRQSKSIGTRALYNYLNQKHKRLISERFKVFESEIYIRIYLNPDQNKELVDFAAKLLGYTSWYGQLKRKEDKGKAKKPAHRDNWHNHNRRNKPKHKKSKKEIEELSKQHFAKIQERDRQRLELEKIAMQFNANNRTDYQI